MKIQHTQNDESGKFFINENDHQIAGLFYSLTSADTLIIEHTEVIESKQGENVGYELVTKAVEYARENGIKIIPACSFAKALFKKTDAFQDVLLHY